MAFHYVSVFNYDQLSLKYVFLTSVCYAFSFHTCVGTLHYLVSFIHHTIIISGNNNLYFLTLSMHVCKLNSFIAVSSISCHPWWTVWINALKSLDYQNFIRFAASVHFAYIVYVLDGFIPICICSCQKKLFPLLDCNFLGMCFT